MRWVAHLLPAAIRTNLPPSVMSDRGPSLGFAVVRERTLFCPHPLCPPLPQGGRGGHRG